MQPSSQSHAIAALTDFFITWEYHIRALFSACLGRLRLKSTGAIVIKTDVPTLSSGLPIGLLADGELDTLRPRTLAGDQRWEGYLEGEFSLVCVTSEAAVQLKGGYESSIVDKAGKHVQQMSFDN
ncbi:hypothetical protein CGLO_16878 [Colletotrichum gloeosporioides Cg-14]|uniref:Uncharacterized protein n=1 Tax=Colletotrichum gloeosporioides (strain Cg-14) TaxID=1237896 RepID=T0KY55_COLGC|nr:hypothetical protein CGLO_16878 [Colletotrichum gloeosporioides Cg-14]